MIMAFVKQWQNFILIFLLQRNDNIILYILLNNSRNIAIIDKGFIFLILGLKRTKKEISWMVLKSMMHKIIFWERIYLLLKLKNKDEINIILHIIDTKSNLNITQKYKKINSKLKGKDKWIYYDEYG